MAGEYIDTTFMDGFVDGPHITEVQTGLANQGLYGPEDYVLEGGRESEAQVLTNNSIRIFDAVYVIQGRRDVIAANDYTDVSIDNGAQEMNRNDIIVRRYTKDESTEIENTEYAVIKGTPVSGEAVDPEVTEGDIRSGATQHDMKLYRVRLEGLNIVAVEPLFKVLYNADTIKEKLDELNEKIPVAVTRLDDGSTDYTYDCYYYPAVGMCVLNLTVNPRVSKTYEAGTTYSLYEIEAGYRPARSISLACYSSGSGVSNCAINSAGAVRYQAKVADVPATAAIQLSGFWFV